MVLRVLQVTAVAAVLLGALAFGRPQSASAQSPVPYNYYVPPTGTCLGTALYPTPRPVPPLVGHTYITYPALNPQEFLYKHHRTYYTQHPSGVTKTLVWWQ